VLFISILLVIIFLALLDRSSRKGKDKKTGCYLELPWMFVIGSLFSQGETYLFFNEFNKKINFKIKKY